MELAEAGAMTSHAIAGASDAVLYRSRWALLTLLPRWLIFAGMLLSAGFSPRTP